MLLVVCLLTSSLALNESRMYSLVLGPGPSSAGLYLSKGCTRNGWTVSLPARTIWRLAVMTSPIARSSISFDSSLTESTLLPTSTMRLDCMSCTCFTVDNFSSRCLLRISIWSSTDSCTAWLVVCRTHACISRMAARNSVNSLTQERTCCAMGAVDAVSVQATGVKRLVGLPQRVTRGGLSGSGVRATALTPRTAPDPGP
mmetsp:Transcript_58839/g.104926  ORF Transcript_58839/g.104926 Transcript_58839/m.104926 type:complete len:200 (-) Transcript_58839:154-753(-)